MQGHNQIIFDRLRGRQIKHHVVVQVCRWMAHTDNPNVIARSWADVEADWSFLTGLTVEIVAEKDDPETPLLHALTTAIQRANPTQLFVTFEDSGETFAIFWRDWKRDEIYYVEIWT